jgi:hypothetical protein
MYDKRWPKSNHVHDRTCKNRSTLLEYGGLGIDYGGIPILFFFLIGKLHLFDIKNISISFFASPTVSYCEYGLLSA